MPLFKATSETVTPKALRAGCTACPLSSTWSSLRHPKIGPEDNCPDQQPLVYFLGEAPGKTEDEQGRPFVGDSGQLLRNALDSWDQEGVPYRIGNVVRCRPPDNRTPKPVEMAACWGAYGLHDVTLSTPHVIVPLGGVPLSQLISGARISDYERVMTPVWLEGKPTWVLPMFHPSYLIRQGGAESELYRFWVHALETLRERVQDGLDPPVLPDPSTYTEGIECLLPSELIQRCREGLPIVGKVLSVDLETTGLMPWEKNARILSASISNGERTIAFLVEHPENPQKELSRHILLKILQQAQVLIAHNAVFEIRWLAKYYGAEVFAWDWADTMAQPYAAHGTSAKRSNDDEATGTRLGGLGYQTQVHYGFNVKRLTNVDPMKWKSTPVKDYLLYNGLDAKWTWKLWHEPVSKELRVEVERQRGAVRSAAAISWRGMLVDTEELASQTQRLEQEAAKEQRDILNDRLVVKWEAENNTRLSITSPQDVAKFFGIASADEEALREVGTKLSAKILRHRKLEKLHSTYAVGIKTAMYEDGYLHPDFATMRVVTGRWSTQKPNAQNMPVRENREFRRVIKPPKGHAIVSFDYAGLEARGIAIATHDLTMLSYVWEDEDIHREWAERLLDDYPEIADRLCPHVTDDEVVVKRVRGEIKNGLVFPQFYGAGIPKCSGELVVPEDVLAPIVADFWRKYAGARKWQRETHAFYDEHGYVETMTGRRRYGPMSWSERLNSPIQGTGSDLVVDASIEILDLAMQMNEPRLVPCINIHDDLTFYLPLQGLERYIQTIAKIMVTPRFDFISVPLKVEVKSSEKNWSDQHELRTYETRDFFTLPQGDIAEQVAAQQRLGAEQGRLRIRSQQRPSAPRVSLNASRRQRDNKLNSTGSRTTTDRQNPAPRVSLNASRRRPT